MKPTTKHARDMSDAELAIVRRNLAREIPQMQSLLNALEREHRRRNRLARQSEAA
jgi:hypothetical protein